MVWRSDAGTRDFSPIRAYWSLFASLRSGWIRPKAPVLRGLAVIVVWRWVCLRRNGGPIKTKMGTGYWLCIIPNYPAHITNIRF